MWHPIRRRPNSLFPDLAWTPACELRLAHTRWDRTGGHPAVPGWFVDRHVAPGRSLPAPRMLRDHPGIFDEPATGAGVSTASGPGGKLDDPADGRSRHQRDWDFLAMHLARARARHEAARPLPTAHEWTNEAGLPQATRDWRTCEAIARYVVEWKNRDARGIAASPHPVDVLLQSHHCGGVANTACALAHVAGIPARRISTSGHSTVEFLIGGRWIWSDNIRDGVQLFHGSFQEFLAGLDRAVWASPGQVAHHNKAEAFYRAPYDISSSTAWRFGTGCPVPATGDEGDAAGGFGLTVHHDPATAEALYPGISGRLFAGDAGGQPWLTIGNKGGWLHGHLTLPKDAVLRRRFFISDCADNPLRDSEARVWSEDGGAGLLAALDGAALKPLGAQTQRHLHRAAVFAVPAALLTPGWHELTVRGSGEVMLFPDAVDPYEPPASLPGLEPARIRTDPCHQP